MTEQAVDTIIIDPLSPEAASSPQEKLIAAQWPEESSTSPWVRAENFARMGWRSTALSTLQAEVAKSSDPRVRAQCYFTAGKIREQLGQFEAAARCYRAVASESLVEGDRYFAHNNLGYCLNRLGQYAEAEAECRQAIAIDPSLFNAHKNLGIALERTGRLEEAAAAYRTAARATESDERPLRHLRVLLATHPEIGRDHPDLAEEAEALRRSARAQRKQVSAESTGPSEEFVQRLLNDIRVADALESNGLQVFGLTWGERLKPIDYATLDDALAIGAIEITEVGEHGTVPTLRVVNRSDRSVLLMAGEQLVGAKQNRVVNTSVMVRSHSEMPMPVSCVEQGRWAYRSKGFRTAGTSSHHALRSMMSRHVAASYRRDGRPSSNQGEVWLEVNRKLMAHESHSPSGALHEAYESMETRLKDFCDQLQPRESWSGAVFAFGGSIMGLDLFDKPSTLGKLWPKLVRAYAIDALESKRSGTVERSEVETWVRSVSRTAIESFPSPGIGNDVRLEGDRLLGALLLVDDVPVHLEAFADDND